MTRAERAANAARGKELGERARAIAFKVSSAFDVHGRADLKALADIGKLARVFETDFNDWWLKQ